MKCHDGSLKLRNIKSHEYTDSGTILTKCKLDTHENIFDFSCTVYTSV